MVANAFRKLSTALPRLAGALLGPKRAAACPICAHRQPALYDGSRSPSLYICPDCRHVYWDRMPTPRELHDFYTRRYCDLHGQQSIQEGNQDYYREHVEHLLHLAGRPRGEVCLVDYGSSIPVLVGTARAAGVGRPIAVDLDEKSWEYARKHGLSMLTPQQYTRLPDGSVTILRFSHVLEHLINPVEAVATAVRKLCPGGLLYITQPNFPVLRPQRADVPLKDSVYPNHLHFFSALSLVRMVQRFPIQIHSLFSTDQQEEAFAELSGLMDLDYARTGLADLAAKGEAIRGPRANYPYYTGENSSLYAFKRAA